METDISRQLSNFYISKHPGAGNRRWVAVHGLMGSEQNWRGFARILGEPILLFDQRGHGRSWHPESCSFTIQNFVEDLEQVTRAHDWEPFVLVGHSLGGRVSLQFAHKYPERVVGLVIVDVGPVIASNIIQSIQSMLSKVPVPFSSRAEAKSVLSQQWPHQAPLAAFLLNNLVEISPGVVSWRFSKPGVDRLLDHLSDLSQWVEWESLQVPVLVVRGASSEHLPHAMAYEMVERQSRARLVEIAGAGHWVQFDQPTRFVQALRDFVHESEATDRGKVT